MLDKFFEWIFSLPLIRNLKPFYNRRKDIVLYLFFGGLTTAVALVSFAIPIFIFGINEMIANTISWILAVAFAFFTNRIYVFNSPTKKVSDFLAQLFSFYGGRLFSFGVEMLIIYIFITRLSYNQMIVKILASILILTLNYIISKWIVFRKKNHAKQ